MSTRARVPAGVTTGGQFVTSARTESAVDLPHGADRYAGCWSVDDFTLEQRKKFDAIHRHAYGWAHPLVGNLGMENTDYAEDYAAWVARRYVEHEFDDDSLGDHKDLHARWDAERAAVAAQHVAKGIDEGLWVSQMSQGWVLSGAEVGKGNAMSFTWLRDELAAAGVYVSEARAASGRLAFTITRLDGDKFGRQVWVGDQTGPRIDGDADA
ncbi:hypothetical protein CHO01_38850 [Cellulomonas hominis]|uniref:Uncharacterized protein n=1 Tax=Cellulomonas hominis TaxID=156981 RepID=A0A511FHN9_9CELL|nr:hypothetical protein [Cellulomonas hominis]MBB5474654.1 hypothetical protein [Cellulomonas hominis]NKY05517.1 hypothetical protein [Cellulomonas hominis]GEL48769.1 hypothetical protein CHO01_38850 [Cellulomonas hominis]